MPTGLFGGSFNPPHVCHILATVWVYETQEVDEIWWLPTDQHAFDKELEAWEHRRRMCERAVGEYGFVRIDDIERRIEGPNHTIDTVRELERRHPDREFALIVGSDILEERDDWKEWEALVERVDLIVVGRDEHAAADSRDPSEFALPDISSTRARDALREREREWLDQWIPSDVLDYIENENLYRD